MCSGEDGSSRLINSQFENVGIELSHLGLLVMRYVPRVVVVVVVRMRMLRWEILGIIG